MKATEAHLYHLSDLGQTRWMPAADVYRTDTGWLIKLELAGVRREDLEVFTHGSCLHVSGVRLDRSVGFDRHPYSLEILYNAFERVLELPISIESCRLAMEFREGMLLIQVHSQEGSP